MIRGVVSLAFALLVTFAVNAFAGDDSGARINGTVSLWGGNTPVEGDVAGARLQVHVPLGQGQHWTISPGLGYGYGHEKNDVTQGPPPIYAYTSTYMNSYWDALVDLLYSSGDNVRLYCGPGLFYSLSSLTQSSTGFPDRDYKPWTAGAQLTLGGGIRVSGTLQLTGSMTQRAGFTTFDQKQPNFENKHSGISHSTQFSVGLRFRL